MKDLDAFYHRVICLKSLCPIRCPVCELSLKEVPEICDELLTCKSTGWEAYTMIWHLQACQNDCHFSLGAQQDWGSFISRYAGRSEVAQRLFYGLIGERKNWDKRQHRDSVRAKKDKGLARQDGIHRTNSSPLWISQKIVPARRLYEGPEIEVIRVKKEVVTDEIPFDRFKRSSYSVMELPRSAKMHTDYETERSTVEFLPLLNHRELWSHFTHKAKTQLPPAPAPAASFSAAAPPAKETTVLSAAAENFSLSSDTPLRSPFAESPPEISTPMNSMSKPNGLLKAPTGPSSPKHLAELDSNQNTLKKPEADSKPVAAKIIVAVPRIFDKHTAIKSRSPHRESDSSFLPSSSLATKSTPTISSTSESSARPHKERYPPAPFGSTRRESRNDSRASASPSPADITTAYPAGVPMPVRRRSARPSASMLRLGMFLNPDEMGQEMAVETHTYGFRGTVQGGLRFIIKTIVDPALSAEEQMARNWKCYEGMFGYFAEMRGDL